MDQESTYIRSNSMEQNNSHPTHESQSNQGRYEWLKFIIFFAGIILISALIIRVIAPMIFINYVPTIVGLSEDSDSSIEPIEPINNSQEVAPEVIPTGERAEEADGDSATAPTEEGSVTLPETDPLTAEESASSKVEDPANTTSPVVYIVRPGDTLTSIAAVHGLTVAQLIQANNLINPNLLKTGQEIVIPE